MTKRLRVVLEVGKAGKRVVAGAVDWPGLDRGGKGEDEVLAKIENYANRYRPVAERAGMGADIVGQSAVEIVERYTGNSSTDYWGIAHVPSDTERQVLPLPELERRLLLLRACWDHFDQTAARVSAELRRGPRGGGWTRDELIRHVYRNEPEQFSGRVGVRTPKDDMETLDGLRLHRTATLDAIRAYNAEEKLAGRWPIQFLIRRMAHHVMDHAWEMEDRDLTNSA